MSAIFYVSYVALWVLVAFQSLVLLGLVRTVYRLEAGHKPAVPAAPSGRLVGQKAPEFTAVDPAGNIVDHRYPAGRESALLFVTPDCTSCMATLAEVSALREKVNGSLVIVCRAGSQECGRIRDTYGLDTVPVVVDDAHEISHLFDVHSTPTAVLVDEAGVVQSYGQPMSADELAELFADGSATAVADGSATAKS
jgi:peroxiredoxin